MTEVWRAPQEQEIVAQVNATEKLVSDFFTNPDNGFKDYWEGISSSKQSFLNAAKVTLAAQNLTDLNFLIKRELGIYKKSGFINNNAVFTDPDDYDTEDVRTFLESKPKAAATATIPIDKQTTVTVGKFILGNLKRLEDPEKSFSQIQREATRDLAMLRYVLGGPGTAGRSNLMGRYLVFSYTSGLAMRALEPFSRPETIVMPVLPPPQKTVVVQPKAPSARKSIGTTDSVLDAIDMVAPRIPGRR